MYKIAGLRKNNALLEYYFSSNSKVEKLSVRRHAKTNFSTFNLTAVIFGTLSTGEEY